MTLRRPTLSELRDWQEEHHLRVILRFVARTGVTAVEAYKAFDAANRRHPRPHPQATTLAGLEPEE